MIMHLKLHKISYKISASPTHVSRTHLMGRLTVHARFRGMTTRANIFCQLYVSGGNHSISGQNRMALRKRLVRHRGCFLLVYVTRCTLLHLSIYLTREISRRLDRVMMILQGRTTSFFVEQANVASKKKGW